MRDMKKKLLSLLFYVWVGVIAAGAQNVDVTITDVNNEALTEKIQATLSAVLTRINNAFNANSEPDFKGINISESASSAIGIMWENSRFRCDETEIVESALNTYNKDLEIRNIPIIMADAEPDDQYHEVAVSFDHSGKLQSFHITISQNLYRQAMLSGSEVTDLRRRQMILDYVEQFRTAYNTKDIGFLDQVFSDDALIITGRVIKVKPSRENNFQNTIISKNVTNKREYLRKLKGVFKVTKTIRVTFDEIKVQMHPTKSDWYGVTLHQGYTSDRYHDDGYLFLLWDFSNEAEPTIHVRTWQPDINTITGKKTAEDEIFGIKDFDVK